MFLGDCTADPRKLEHGSRMINLMQVHEEHIGIMMFQLSDFNCRGSGFGALRVQDVEGSGSGVWDSGFGVLG